MNAFGIALTELVAPGPNRFASRGHAALGHQLLDIAIADREPEIQPHAVTDDFRGKTVATVGLLARRSVPQVLRRRKVNSMPIPLYTKKTARLAALFPPSRPPTRSSRITPKWSSSDPRWRWIAQHCCLLSLATTKHTRFCCSAERVNSLSWIKSAPTRRCTLTTTKERMYASVRNSPIVNVRNSALSSNSCLEVPI